MDITRYIAQIAERLAPANRSIRTDERPQLVERGPSRSWTGGPHGSRCAWQTGLMDESADYDFSPTSGAKHLDQVFEELAVRRVLMTDEVPFEPLWAALLKLWSLSPPGTR
jgi:hypothetical protein